MHIFDVATRFVTSHVRLRRGVSDSTTQSNPQLSKACYSHALPPRTAMHLTDSPTTSPTPVTTTTRQVKDMPHALSQSEPADRVQMAGQQAARGGAGATFPANT